MRNTPYFLPAQTLTLQKMLKPDLSGTFPLAPACRQVSPLPSGDRIASPFMVRQAHHERTMNNKYQLQLFRRSS
jgi:hypothetical protein